MTINSSLNKKTILLFGVGWLGRELIHSLSENEYDIYVATRRSKKQIDFGRPVHFLNVSYHSNQLSFIDSSIHKLSFDVAVVMLPPSGFNDYSNVIRSICEQVDNVKQLIYTSSTGVYQEFEGLVNEHSDIDENNVIYKAEQFVRLLLPNNHTILRLSGLVAEDRHPVKFLLNRSHISNGESPVNLIHREDVIRAIKILFESNNGGGTYNLSYPDHPSRAEYYNSFSQKFYGESINFEKKGKGKTIDGSKFVMHYTYEYLRPIKEIEINL